MNRLKWIKLSIVVILLLLVSLCFASWDNDKPADSDVWNDAAGYIRANWDALEAVLGTDLDTASGLYLDVRSYGTYTTDIGNSINLALAALPSTGGTIRLPASATAFPLTTQISITKPCEIIGMGRGATTIEKQADVIGMVINTTGRVVLQGFTLDSDGSDASKNGITITEFGRSRISDVCVKDQSNHGIEFIKGNLSSFRDLQLLSNGGDGFKVNGTHDAPNTNACIFSNLDCRNNTGWGFNLENGRENFASLITAQTNTGGGTRINDRSNMLFLYSETNVGNDVELTNEANTKQNVIFKIQGTLADNSAGLNDIWSNAVSPGIPGFITKLQFWAGLRLDDITIVGILDILHDTDRQYDFIASGTSSHQTIKFSNSVAGYVLNITIDGSFISTIATLDDEATPSVGAGGNTWLTGGTTTITDFDGGVTGQIITIIGQHTLTITDGTDIVLDGGANMSMTSGDTLMLIQLADTKWYQLSESDNN